MTTPPDATAVLPERVYARMALLLRAGLLIGLTILVGALIAYLLRFPTATLASAIATNPILGYLGANGLARGLASGQPAAYLTLGLLALVATPLVRVASGAFVFHQHREHRMVAITIAVLVMLLFGLLVLGPLVG